MLAVPASAFAALPRPHNDQGTLTITASQSHPGDYKARWTESSARAIAYTS